MQLPQVRTLALSGGQFITGVIAAGVFFSSKSVDLYAAWDKFYTGFQLMLGGWAIFVPVAIAGYQVYMASTKQKMTDVVADPVGAAAAAQSMPVTPASVAIADALTKAP